MTLSVGGNIFSARCSLSGRHMEPLSRSRPNFFVVNFLLFILFLLMCDALNVPDQLGVVPAQTSAFLHTTDVVSVTVGDSAVLGCQVDYDKRYKVIWLFNSNTLTFNEQIVTTDDRFHLRRVAHSKDVWDLAITGVHESDAGNYSCFINTSPPQRRIVRLIVKVPPRIVSDPLQQLEIIPEDTHLQVACKAEGKPRPQVQWMKEDHEGKMHPIDLLQTSTDLFVDGSDLIVSNARRWMEGTYVCIAENGIYPPARKTLTLTVQFRPVVKFINSRLGQQLGGVTMLQCKVDSNPTSHVTWKFNGTPIEPEPKSCPTMPVGQRICKEIYIQEDSLQKQVDLLIRNVTAADYGTYACVASSRLGTSQAVAELYKIVPNDPPYISRRFQNDAGRGRNKDTPSPGSENQPTGAPSSTRISVISSANSRGPNGVSDVLPPSLLMVFSLAWLGQLLLPSP